MDLVNKPKNQTEKELWNRFCSGDDAVYAQFFRQHVDALFSYGMRFTSNRELVQDCIQDVFVKIYTNRLRLGRTDNVKLYLFTALKNTLFNVFDKNKTLYHIDTVEPVFTVEYTIEDVLISDELEQEREEKVARVLEVLSPRQKEVIYYRYTESMRLEEIAALMKMNCQSVQNLLQRALKKAKIYLIKQKESGNEYKNSKTLFVNKTIRSNATGK